MESLKQKEKERDEFLKKSVEKLSNLARELGDGHINQSVYDKEHERIKKKTEIRKAKTES